MIGVLAEPSDARVVEELFEIFKTPWEIYDSRKSYPVVICGHSQRPPADTPLAIVYDSEPGNQGRGQEPLTRMEPGKPFDLVWEGTSFPIYQGAVLRNGTGFLKHVGESDLATGFIRTDLQGNRTVWIGYDLFREVEFLLGGKQPARHAGTPTLDIHVAVLRAQLIAAAIPFAEIDSRPFGYDFAVCPTHDIDFASVRDHFLDATMFGFLYRALWSSLMDALRGRMAWRRWLKNVGAALSLPLVLLGILPDSWRRFDRYVDLPRERKSTFFLLPQPNHRGHGIETSEAPARRAVKYSLEDVSEQLGRIAEAGGEIGLHGLDAWHNLEAARAEAERVGAASGKRSISGTRSHWLYFGEDSYRILDEAGFDYDSTCGYNDAVGFRAGTAIAFRPLSAKHLLEMPLIIQDTAMFYRGRMALDADTALALCARIIEQLVVYGGTLVINWHGRSLFPERLWGEFYEKLLERVDRHTVWYGTCREMSAWYRVRRQTAVVEVGQRAASSDLRPQRTSIRIALPIESREGPPLRLLLWGRDNRGRFYSRQLSLGESGAGEALEFTF